MLRLREEKTNEKMNSLLLEKKIESLEAENRHLVKSLRTYREAVEKSSIQLPSEIKHEEDDVPDLVNRHEVRLSEAIDLGDDENDDNKEDLNSLPNSEKVAKWFDDEKVEQFLEDEPPAPPRGNNPSEHNLNEIINNKSSTIKEDPFHLDDEHEIHNEPVSTPSVITSTEPKLKLHLIEEFISIGHSQDSKADIMRLPRNGTIDVTPTLIFSYPPEEMTYYTIDSYLDKEPLS